MAKWPEVSTICAAEVERLRVELEQARIDRDAWRTAWEHANKGWRKDFEIANARADRLQAERDDLAARLQSIQQAERKYTAAKLHEAAKMRKGEAL